MNFRSERVGKLIREELSKMILREVELPALATITEVEVDKNLEGARVKVSVLPASGEKAVLAELTNERGIFSASPAQKNKHQADAADRLRDRPRAGERRAG